MNKLSETGGPRSTEAAASSGRGSVTMSCLLVLAVGYTLHHASDILMPVTVAAILALVLKPLVRALRRVKIPEPLAAGVIVAAIFAALVAAIFFLAEPATKWISQLPGVVSELQEKLEEPLNEIKDAKKEVEDIVHETNGDTGTPSDAAPQRATQTAAEPQPAPPPQTRITLIEVFTQTLGVMRDVGWSVVIIFVMLYFLLATGTMFRENVIMALPSRRDKRRALEVTRAIERDMSIYLATVLLVNIGLGVAIGVSMHAIGLPNAVLWGAMAALLNFIPYLGAVLGGIVVMTVGLVSFDAPVQALLAPFIYIAVNAFEAYFITPTILSRRLTINPIAVFLSVIFWGWIWGIPGALIAVPILTCIKVISDTVDRLAPISQFLNGRRLK